MVVVTSDAPTSIVGGVADEPAGLVSEIWKSSGASGIPSDVTGKLILSGGIESPSDDAVYVSVPVAASNVTSGMAAAAAETAATKLPRSPELVSRSVRSI